MYPTHRWSTISFLILIILSPLLLFWRWIFKGEVLFWGTSLLQFWPWHHLAAKDILSGEWPLWNPLLGNGAPLMANLQTAVFYPFNLLYLFMPVEHGLTFSIMLHLVLAGLFMYIYTRRIGLLPFAAILSSLTYMLSGYIVGRTQFVPMVNTVAWYPLLLFLSDKLAIHRRVSDVLWLGIVLAIQLLAGHAQLWFYGLWLIGLYIWFRTRPKKSRPGVTSPTVSLIECETLPPQAILPETHRQRRVEQAKAKIKNLLRLGLAISLAILLSAVQILPTAEFIIQSPRHSGAERTFALTYSFWPWRLLTLLAPDLFGHPAQNNYWGYTNYWEDHAYLGVLPFLLALVAIWDYVMGKIWGRRILHTLDNPKPVFSSKEQNLSSPLTQPWRVVPFFAILAPLSLVLALGWNTPIYLWVFDFIPGFGFFQAPARLLIWYTVAMAVLAGIGAQYFKLTPFSRRAWQRLLVAALGLILAGLAGHFILVGRSYTFGAASILLGGWLAISAFLLLNRPRPGSTRSIFFTSFNQETFWQWLVLVWVVFDLLWAAWPLNPMLPANIYTQPITSANFLKTQPDGFRFWVDEEFDYTTKFNHYLRFSTWGPTETTYWQNLRETLVPNLGIYPALASANNYDPLVVRRWQQLVDLLKDTNNASASRKRFAQSAEDNDSYPVGNESQQTKLLALMNVRYIIDDPKGQPGLYNDGFISIQQIPEPLPRAYFVSQVYQAKDEIEAIARLTSSDFDYHREVIIMEKELDIKTKVGAQTQETTETVTITTQNANEVKLVVTAPTSGFVVLTDTFYPGWQVTVDGQPAHIWPANLAFRTVNVEAGVHKIVFSYQPRSFTIGLWISIIAWFAVVIVGSKNLRQTHIP